MRTAAYARYSTAMQSEASLDDQLRNVRERCAREGWPPPTVFADAAISGARADRPQYQALLAAALEGRFDVVLVDDLSRLSRDKDRCGDTLKRLTFAGVRVIGVSDGIDTAAKGHKVNATMRGLMSELYLDDLAEKTHRGLTGRALAGASAGGLPYGYEVTQTGKRAIRQEHAQVIRRIFEEFAAGRSPRAIASALNADGAPAPRGSTWCQTAIYGDLRRGIGILANAIYVGQQIWNRSRWVKHPDTGRRIRKERPESEWIIAEVPELAIVDRRTWDTAQARLGGSPRAPVPVRKGRPPRHLLSGLLRCYVCGGPMVMVNQCSYGCSIHKDRGDSSCASTLRVSKVAVESAVLAGIRSQLLTEEAWRRAERRLAARAKDRAPDIAALAVRVRAAETVHANIMTALRAGVVTPSTRTELLKVEGDLEAARDALAQAKAYQPTQIVPRARERWRKLCGDLDGVRGLPQMRAALEAEIGPSIVIVEENGAVYAEIGADEKKVVAGAGYVLSLTEPLRIPIPTKPSREG